MNAVVRRWGRALPWVRAALATGGMAWLLGSLSFTPEALGWFVAVAVGLLMLAWPVLAVLVAVMAVALPLVAVSPLTAAVLVVLSALGLRLLARHDGRGFLVVLLSLVGVAIGPAWAAAVLAGYLFGATHGAVIAVVACLVVQGAGLALGADALGPVATGGLQPALVALGPASASVLSFEWVGGATSSLSGEIGALRDAVGTLHDIPLLLIQPIVWGAGAAVAGSLAPPLGGRARITRGLLAVGAGVAVIAVGTTLSWVLLADAVAGADIALSAGLSLAAAVVGVLVSDGLFSPVCAPRGAAPGRGGLRVDDAEVDELLNMLAAAEDALVAKHTVEAVVMITDMKSFSAMTEEEGSVGSARLVQRHRDLLLPVIGSHRGAGKPTGGDGLVAAFPDAAHALEAAVEMQRALVAHARKHPDERAISVRIGLASGEVVVDSGGRPFIGAGLNLAARVMNLGDGGCIMATRATVDAASGVGPGAYNHGCFELKNIATPVEVVEVLWHEGQAPTDLPGGSAPSMPPESAGE